MTRLHFPHHGSEQKICGAARSGEPALACSGAFVALPNQNSQDSAPDIYETPELTDDTSTVPVRVFLLDTQQGLPN